jgi:eukaryotic-like serine/threonine-protein kinase
MPLAPGTKLGPYEIFSSLGHGGMGEVYRARDAKLARDVAIKVLPQALASDPECMIRFEREAKLLASVSHANIASVYGFEESEGIGALVMELVDGPTLAERLKSGPLPVDDVLPVAKQITEALECAHERGIIHRDLKPANIKLLADGTVKVLDFGLAKVLEDDGSTPDISTSPTISRMATRAGIILGTAGYMSPEQAKGKSVDRRTDIWAFGCVLFEMLTATGTFDGETVTDVLASVVMKEPDWARLPVSTPLRIRELLRHCLKKDPKQRLQSIGDARIAIDETIQEPRDGATPQLAPVHYRTRWLSVLPWIFAVSFAGATLWFLFPHSPPLPPSPPIVALLASGVNIDDPKISPDGTAVAYDDGAKLWIRNFRDLEPHPIDGTEGGHDPFWSPDSKSLGYFRENEIRRISVSGGPSNLICNLGSGEAQAEATWGADDRVVFSMFPSSLFEVSALGGQPKLLAKADPSKDEYLLRSPHFLSDGKTLLMIVRRPGSGFRLDTIAVQSETDRHVILQIPGARLLGPVPSERTGHILFYEIAPNNGIWAVPFSYSKLKVTGQPFLVRSKANSISASLEGSIVYLAGVDDSPSGLVWIDRIGKVGHIFGSAKPNMRQASVNHAGNQVAVVSVENRWSIWIQDPIRNLATNPASGFYSATSPAWTRDDKNIVFSCQETSESPQGLCIAASDGSSKPKLLVAGPQPRTLTLTPDGRIALFSNRDDQGRYDIFSVPLIEGAKPEPLLISSASQLGPQFSPDGHYIAYQSDESGRYEIYVRPFPKGDAKWMISTNGGLSPKWNPSGRELFFVEGDKLMAAPVEIQPSFRAGIPVALFSAREAHVSLTRLTEPLYDVAPGGARFVAVGRPEDGHRRVVYEQNWIAQLDRK